MSKVLDPRLLGKAALDAPLVGKWQEIRYYGRHHEVVEVPDLTEIQTRFYYDFLQAEVPPEKREQKGLHSIITEAFPIQSFGGQMQMDYVRYDLGRPRYTPDECRNLRLTYGAPFKLRLRLNKPGETIEEEVYLGELPLMIGGGEFIINGAERVIVTQLHRSPGVDFSLEVAEGDKKLHTCWIIPERGSWIELNVTKKDTLAVRIDQSGKFGAMTLFRAMSPKYSTNEDIIRLFYDTRVIPIGGRRRLLMEPILEEFTDRHEEVIDLDMPDGDLFPLNDGAERHLVSLWDKSGMPSWPAPKKVFEFVVANREYEEVDQLKTAADGVVEQVGKISLDVLQAIADHCDDTVWRKHLLGDDGGLTAAIDLNTASEETLRLAFTTALGDRPEWAGEIEAYVEEVTTAREEELLTSINELKKGRSRSRGSLTDAQLKKLEPLVYCHVPEEGMPDEPLDLNTSTKAQLTKLFKQAFDSNAGWLEAVDDTVNTIIEARKAKNFIDVRDIKSKTREVQLTEAQFSKVANYLSVRTAIDLNLDTPWSEISSFPLDGWTKQVWEAIVALRVIAAEGRYQNIDALGTAANMTAAAKAVADKWKKFREIVITSSDTIDVSRLSTPVIGRRASRDVLDADENVIIRQFATIADDLLANAINKGVTQIAVFDANVAESIFAAEGEVNEQGLVEALIADFTTEGHAAFQVKEFKPRSIAAEKNLVAFTLEELKLGKGSNATVVPKFTELDDETTQTLVDSIDDKIRIALVDAGEARHLIGYEGQRNKANRAKLLKQVLTKYVVSDVIDLTTGEMLLEGGSLIASQEKAEQILDANIDQIMIIENMEDPLILNSLQEDPATNHEEALIRIFQRLRPGSPQNIDKARDLFHEKFYDSSRYKLGRVGRFRLNRKFGSRIGEEVQILQQEDLGNAIKYIMRLRSPDGADSEDLELLSAEQAAALSEAAMTGDWSAVAQIDDIDHLGNRRVKTIDELTGDEIRKGFLKLKKNAQEKMNMDDLTGVTPRTFINSKTISSAVNFFFGRGELSQVVDQTNPLSQLNHERRLSALGPGGLNRKRAGFDVRDVHISHYGRICPIETPEGTNIGLISSLAVFATLDDYGFLTTPYHVVTNGGIFYKPKVLDNPKAEVTGRVTEVTLDSLIVEDKDGKRHVHKIKLGVRAPEEDGFVNETFYHQSPIARYGDQVRSGQLLGGVVATQNLRADQETAAIIAPADVDFDEKGRFNNEIVMARIRDEFTLVPREKIQYMDVSPKQLVGVSASLIPFLEHDDANRALMGSNMQRQAVPLVRTELPRVCTGMERAVARNSGMVICAPEDGTIQSADGVKIEMRGASGRDYTFPLRKFVGLNERTCLNQKPLISEGDSVIKGEPLVDSAATRAGELALGKNVLVAFMPWDGYNFEDAILVSERLVRDDVYTSIHIDEFEVEIRETKLGKEEFTREIPHVSEKARRNLDEDGVVRVGTKVSPGDILVGKVAPKSKSELSPEEKLLHAIFGKAGEDVKNDSLEVPSGVEGIVINTQAFSKKASLTDDEKKKRLTEQKASEEEFTESVRNALRVAIKELEELTSDGKLRYKLDGRRVKLGPETDEISLKRLEMSLTVDALDLDMKKRETAIQITQRMKDKIDEADQQKFARENKLTRGDELPTGVLEMRKVYVATKRTLSVGDKFAGRHGNKGVVSRVMPIEDMPFLADGTPVDMCLNPLGVPSRMNVGQILEIHLGWAAHMLGFQAISPVFNGASEADIEVCLEEAGLPHDGKAQLFDGRSGEAFDQRTTVGYLYMLKLHHLVDDKVHARATGPYSLITQQPLGGKARFGGQRFGEMEVWALEAYGAANILQELLTVKSDDVDGRTKIYESMVKGANILEPGTPISFDVLCNEIRGLALNIELNKKKILPDFGPERPNVGD